MYAKIWDKTLGNLAPRTVGPQRSVRLRERCLQAQKQRIKPRSFSCRRLVNVGTLFEESRRERICGGFRSIIAHVAQKGFKLSRFMDRKSHPGYMWSGGGAWRRSKQPPDEIICCLGFGLACRKQPKSQKSKNGLSRRQKLDNARKLTGICFIDPEDEESEESFEKERNSKLLRKRRCFARWRQESTLRR